MSAAVLVVMGVSGAGKSTIARCVAHRLGWVFLEADDLHSPASIAKMRRGQPLDDADRAPWLARIAAWIDDQAAGGQPAVIACSALKRAYRQILTAGRPFVRLVYICGSHELIAQRLAERKGHYFPPELLDSQFATLEPPGPDENPIVVDAALPIGDQAAQIVLALAA